MIKLLQCGACSHQQGAISHLLSSRLGPKKPASEMRGGSPKQLFYQKMRPERHEEVSRPTAPSLSYFDRRVRFSLLRLLLIIEQLDDCPEFVTVYLKELRLTRDPTVEPLPYLSRAAFEQTVSGEFGYSPNLDNTAARIMYGYFHAWKYGCDADDLDWLSHWQWAVQQTR